MDVLVVLLALAVGALGMLALSLASSTLDRALTWVALEAFGEHTREHREHRERGLARGGASGSRVAALHASHTPSTYRVYASKTLLYATVVALAGSVIGVWLAVAAVTLMATPEATLTGAVPGVLDPLASALASRNPDTLELFGLFLASNATVGVVSGLAVYELRWRYPAFRADERARRIDASMARTVAFVYALSRSGMSFQDVLRTLARNNRAYGEAAREVRIAVREIDAFGTDIHEALERVARRTPSEDMSEFAENLVSVLHSGRDLAPFLRDQYDRYREEATAHQERYLDLVATLAEVYVTLFVAAPLFLITILVVLGLAVGDTLSILRAVGYLMLPLATLGFVVLLDSITDPSSLEAGGRRADHLPFAGLEDVRRAEDAATDGGGVERRDPNAARLAAHDRLRPLRERLENPLDSVLARPDLVLAVTVPLAVLYVLATAGPEVLDGPMFAGEHLGRNVDDPLVHGTLFVLATYALVYELRQRRVRAVEAVVPDLLDRLASLNEAGSAVVESVRTLADSNLGELDEEIERTWTDIQLGTNVRVALWGLERRVRTPSVTRAVALVTNAMRASGDLGAVLRIAAEEAQAARRLRRSRRQELFTYTVVIYVSFLVFIGIVVALSTVFVPAIPEPSDLGTDLAGQVAAGVGGISQETKDAYELVFFHTALVQAVCSGLVAGQMSEGDLRAGAKHAALMLAVAYGAFLLLA